MKRTENESAIAYLSAQKLIQQELKVVNAILKKVDLSKIKTLAKGECAR